jgi:hypothetical protein
MAKRPTEEKLKRKKPGSGPTVKLTIAVPSALHARLVAYSVLSEPRTTAERTVLEWIRDGLREYHPPKPKPRSRGVEPVAGTVGPAEGEEIGTAKSA